MESGDVQVVCGRWEKERAHQMSGEPTSSTRMSTWSHLGNKSVSSSSSAGMESCKGRRRGVRGVVCAVCYCVVEMHVTGGVSACERWMK